MADDVEDPTWGDVFEGLSWAINRELQPLDHLKNLLAVIHRDGGHHTQRVGLDKSVKDAREVWSDLMKSVDRLESFLAAEQGREGLPGWEYVQDYEDSSWQKKVGKYRMRAFAGGYWEVEDQEALEAFVDDEGDEAPMPWRESASCPNAWAAMESAEEALKRAPKE